MCLTSTISQPQVKKIVLEDVGEVKLLCCVRLFATPWTVAHQATLFMGFSRQEYWSGLPFLFSRGPSQPRDQTQVSCIAGRRFNLWAISSKALRTKLRFSWKRINSSLGGLLQTLSENFQIVCLQISNLPTPSSSLEALLWNKSLPLSLCIYTAYSFCFSGKA